MPYWNPDTRWAGEDVYIIGGGPSLSGFQWERLRYKNTIGCNAAFRLGVDICKVVIFSDLKWYHEFKEELAQFKGDVFTHCDSLHAEPVEWLKTYRREKRGLHKSALCFGGNTGCGAVNLALIMGARRVFLMGFDCTPPVNDKSHWHNWRIERPNLAVYPKFIEGWSSVHATLGSVFPGTQIINLNPDSGIPFFPKESLAAHFEYGPHHTNACR